MCVFVIIHYSSLLKLMPYIYLRSCEEKIKIKMYDGSNVQV